MAIIETVLPEKAANEDRQVYRRWATAISKKFAINGDNKQFIL